MFLWLQPLALWGLVALAIPVLLHLLVRRQHLRIAFPSLRFLPAAKLAAMRRWRLSDWPLLVVRMLILLLAVAAWSAPVVVSSARRVAWGERVARAIIVVPATDGSNQQPGLQTAIETAKREAYAHALFESRVSARDRLADAVAWLERQPPSRRDVLIVGDFREGLLDEGDLLKVPAHVGITLQPVTASGDDATRTFDATGEGPDGTTAVREIRAALAGDATTTSVVRDRPATAPVLVARAAPDEQPIADAVVRAVLAEGVRLPRSGDRQVVVIFDGAPGTQESSPAGLTIWMRDALARLGLTGRAESGALIVEAGLRPSDAGGLRRVADIAHAVFDEDLAPFEPRRIDARRLAAWSRPPGDVPADARPANEGDHRYLWLAVLALLGAEQWVRRSRAMRPETLAAGPAMEDRVA